MFEAMRHQENTLCLFPHFPIEKTMKQSNRDRGQDAKTHHYCLVFFKNHKARRKIPFSRILEPEGRKLKKKTLRINNEEIMTGSGNAFLTSKTNHAFSSFPHSLEVCGRTSEAITYFTRGADSIKCHRRLRNEIDVLQCLFIILTVFLTLRK